MVCNQRAGVVLLEIHPRLCKSFEHSVGLVYTQNVFFCIRYESFGEVFIDECGHAAKLAPGKIFYLFYLCARCIVKGARAEIEHELAVGKQFHIVHGTIEPRGTEFYARAHSELLLNFGVGAYAGEHCRIIAARRIARNHHS